MRKITGSYGLIAKHTRPLIDALPVLGTVRKRVRGDIGMQGRTGDGSAVDVGRKILEMAKEHLPGGERRS